MMVKALIFDLDNTLIDRQRAFKEMLKDKFSLLCDDHSLVDQMVKDVLIWDNNGVVSRDISLGSWADKYHYDRKIAEDISNDWANTSGEIAYLFYDVRDTLTELKKKYTIAILTNGNAVSQRKKLKTINIDGLIDYSLVSGECNYKKPEKEIFELVLNDLNLKADEAIYIGDNYNIDVLGPRSIGMKAIYVSRNNEIHRDATTINNIHELLDLDFNRIL